MKQNTATKSGAKRLVQILAVLALAGSMPACLTAKVWLSKTMGVDLLTEEDVKEISMEKPWFYKKGLTGNSYRVYDRGRYIAKLEEHSFSISEEALSMATMRAEATESETNAKVDLYQGNAKRVGWDPRSPYEGKTAEQLREMGLLKCQDDFRLPHGESTDQFQGDMPDSDMVYALEMKSIEGKLQLVPISHYWAIEPVCTKREKCSLRPEECIERRKKYKEAMKECKNKLSYPTKEQKQKCEESAQRLLPPTREVITTDWIDEVFWTAWDENQKDVLRSSHIECKELSSAESRARCEQLQEDSSTLEKQSKTPVGMSYISWPPLTVQEEPETYKGRTVLSSREWREPASALIAYFLQKDEPIYDELMDFKTSNPEEYKQLRLDNKLYRKFPLTLMRDPADVEAALAREEAEE